MTSSGQVTERRWRIPGSRPMNLRKGRTMSSSWRGGTVIGCPRARAASREHRKSYDNRVLAVALPVLLEYPACHLGAGRTKRSTRVPLRLVNACRQAAPLSRAGCCNKCARLARMAQRTRIRPLLLRPHRSMHGMAHGQPAPVCGRVIAKAPTIALDLAACARLPDRAARASAAIAITTTELEGGARVHSSQRPRRRRASPGRT